MQRTSKGRKNDIVSKNCYDFVFSHGLPILSDEQNIEINKSLSKAELDARTPMKINKNQALMACQMS